MHIIVAHTVAALGPIRDQPSLYRSLMFLGSFVRTWSSGLLQSELLSCATTSCVVDYLCCSCGKRPQVTVTDFTCEVFLFLFVHKGNNSSCILRLCTKPCVYADMPTYLTFTFHLMKSFNSYSLVLT